MLLDRSLRATIRNFSTLFLIVFVVLFPIHLIYGLFFQDVLALRELHPAIEDFPSSRQVRGVGQTSLAQARIGFWIVVLIEIALIPLFMRFMRNVLDADERGEVPTVPGALRRAERQTWEPGAGNRPVTMVVGVAIAVVVGVLVHAIVMTIVDLLPDVFAFAGIALAEATSRSAAAAFALVAILHALKARTLVPREKVPDLY